MPLSPAVRYLVDTNSLDPSLIPASGPHSRLLKGCVINIQPDVLGYPLNDDISLIRTLFSPNNSLCMQLNLHNKDTLFFSYFGLNWKGSTFYKVCILDSGIYIGLCTRV